MDKLKVLIVDDSAYNRQTLSRILSDHPDIEVVGKAFDGEEALKLVGRLEPDLITLDVEMPRMDGFTFLRILMSQAPTPVIVISSHSRKQDVFQALELGALDFIAKPSHHIDPEGSALADELISKALTVRNLRLLPIHKWASRAPRAMSTEDPTESPGLGPLERLVCIGASTGGPTALESLFRAVGSFDGTGFMVSQHMPAKFTKAFAERLNRISPMSVVEAQAGMPVVGCQVLIAPGGQHMGVIESPEGLSVELKGQAKEDHYAPSIDHMFHSVARCSPVQTLGVVMTGMGADGASGIQALHQNGARTVAESEDSSIVFGMPKEAIATGHVDEVLPLDALIARVLQFASGKERALGQC